MLRKFRNDRYGYTYYGITDHIWIGQYYTSNDDRIGGMVRGGESLARASSFCFFVSKSLPYIGGDAKMKLKNLKEYIHTKRYIRDLKNNENLCLERMNGHINDEDSTIYLSWSRSLIYFNNLRKIQEKKLRNL